jgi:diguanylate cyclase (GGDEF)-like protein
MREELGALVEATQRVMDASSLQEGLGRVSDAALELLGADHASVRLCAEDGTLRPAARSGVAATEEAPPFRTGEGVLGWAAENGRAALVDDVCLDLRYQPRPGPSFPMRSVLCVPIARGERVLGVLSASSDRAGLFGGGEERLALLLASHARELLRTAELEQLTITDPHTLAYNRRYLLPRIEEEMRRADRSGEPLSLLLMDLDRFKRVNDRHGHAVGDAVIRAFADAVRPAVRAGDVLFRRGGEEFVLLMPGAGAREARTVAERLRGLFSGGPLLAGSGVRVRQTVSIGVATWDRREPPESLELRADRGLYAAKRAGRDRVVVSAR